jgi:hypothetical protein
MKKNIPKFPLFRITKRFKGALYIHTVKALKVIVDLYSVMVLIFEGNTIMPQENQERHF